MAHIDYFFATLSPYAYLQGNRLEEIGRQHGATITYKPFDLITAFGRNWWATGPRTGTASAGKEYRRLNCRSGQENWELPFNSSPRIGQPTARLHPMRIIAAPERRRRWGKLLPAFFMTAVWARGTWIFGEDQVRSAIA